MPAAAILPARAAGCRFDAKPVNGYFEAIFSCRRAGCHASATGIMVVFTSFTSFTPPRHCRYHTTESVAISQAALAPAGHGRMSSRRLSERLPVVPDAEGSHAAGHWYLLTELPAEPTLPSRHFTPFRH